MTCVECGVSTEPDPRGGFARCPKCREAMFERTRSALRNAGRKKLVPKVDYDHQGQLTAEDRRRLEAHRQHAAKAPRRPIAAERADAIAALITERGRMSRRELASALGISPTSAAEAAGLAVADGRITSKSGSAKTAGYYPPESAAA